MFDEAITVRYIASSLVSYDFHRTATKIKAALEKRDFDVVGVRVEGIVSGYAKSRDLTTGFLGHHLLPFTDDYVIPIDYPLLEALELVRHHGTVFVTALGEVTGIVTRADVLRAPIRLWLFGLITVLEMQVTRLIKRRYPDDSWKQHLTPKRIAKAENIRQMRADEGTEVDLVDCLTMFDKRTVLVKSPDLLVRLGIDAEEADELLDSVTELRNNLAHAHPIADKWPQFLEDARAMENIIKNAESISARELRP